MMEPVGLIAAAGRFPVAFATKARQIGLPVVCVGLRHLAPPDLASLCDRFHWHGLAKLGAVIRRFKSAGVREIVMAGKIHKTELLKPWRVVQLMPDWRGIQFWYSRTRRDNKDDTLLLGVIAEFERDGLRIGSALDYCPELLVRHGQLSRRPVTAHETQDIAFGWELAKEMGRLDVGQSVAVHDRAVLAVEAIEGTDQAILRAGKLCRGGGFTVVKVAKPQQDMRFDVPTIGTTTIESMRTAGARVLAIEAGKTILLDEADTLALADRYGISIVAVDAGVLARAA
ncbi:MAG: UDP-2,3-diacylglucosamine diphosphatase LpxI [Gemmataceae bacterium]